jgi:hypothetical protein
VEWEGGSRSLDLWRRLGTWDYKYEGYRDFVDDSKSHYSQPKLFVVAVVAWSGFLGQSLLFMILNLCATAPIKGRV